jgi:hypothetical protein
MVAAASNLRPQDAPRVRGRQGSQTSLHLAMRVQSPGSLVLCAVLLVGCSPGKGRRSEAVGSSVAIRSAAPAGAPEAPPRPPSADGDTALARACSEVEHALALGMRMTTGRSRGDTAFADPSGTGTHRGCFVTGHGVADQASATGDPAADLKAMLHRRGWTTDPAFDADGPDGSAGGVRRGGVLCYWNLLSESEADDSDTTSAPADTGAWRKAPLDATVSCTRPSTTSN